MGKPQNQPRRVTTLIPGGDMSLLTDLPRLKEEVARLEPQKRQKFIALLCAFHQTKQLSDILGVKLSYIKMCCNRHREIIDASHISRCASIANFATRKVINVIADIDSERLTPDKRPQAAKYLMEVAEMATNQVTPKEEVDEGNTMELIFRVKGKMQQPSQPKEIEKNVPIDAQYTVVEEKK